MQVVCEHREEGDVTVLELPRLGEHLVESTEDNRVHPIELAEELEPELELEEGRTPDRPSPYSTALAIQSTTCAVERKTQVSKDAKDMKVYRS